MADTDIKKYFLGDESIKYKFPFILKSYTDNKNGGLNAGNGASINNRVTVHPLCSSTPKTISTCQWEFDGYIDGMKGKGFIKNKHNLNLFISANSTDNTVKYVTKCDDDNCRWNIIPVDGQVRIVNNNGVGLRLPSNMRADAPIETSWTCNFPQKIDKNQSIDKNCLWTLDFL